MFKEFNFKQVAPDTTWTINHGFGEHVIADVLIGNAKAYPASMTQSSDKNTLTLTWTYAYAGSVRVVTSNKDAISLDNASWVPDQIGLNPDYVPTP